jgi:Protein of unknown function (DUF2934)
MAKRQTKADKAQIEPRASAPDASRTPPHGDAILETSASETTALADPPTGLTYDDIAARAYDLWARRGHAHGSDFEDWLQAERELREERDPRRRR